MALCRWEGHRRGFRAPIGGGWGWIQRLETTSGGSALTSPLLNKLDRCLWPGMSPEISCSSSLVLPSWRWGGAMLRLDVHDGEVGLLFLHGAHPRRRCVGLWSRCCRLFLYLPADLRMVCRRQLILYLPVGVPKWRLFCTRSAALFGCSVPCGDGAAGRDGWRRRDGGHSGPDCFS